MARGLTWGNLLPLFIVIVLLGVIAAVGFVVWTIANDVGKHTRHKLEKRNISFTKEGAKVGVKEKSSEQQQDEAQNVLVKIWSNSYFPAYKSRLGWMEGKTDAASSGTEKRAHLSRSSSSQGNIQRTSSNPTVARTTSSQNVK